MGCGAPFLITSFDPEGAGPYSYVINPTIGPGEAIFLPVGWWHHVEALDVSISMSFTNFDADNDFVSDYPPDTRF